MIYRTIPNTDLHASVISIGTAEIGGSIDTETSYKILDLYIEKGGNLIDTAHVYADWHNKERSSSEKTIGKWLKQRGNRDKVILVTKGGHPEVNTMHISRLSRDEILKDIDESLQFLGVDFIDIYYLHRDNTKIPASELIEILNEKIKEGKIRYIGCSNWRWERIEEANSYAKSKGLKPFVISQIQWSYATINPGSIKDKTLVAMDENELEFYKKNKLPVAAFTSQAMGFFSKLDTVGIAGLKQDVKDIYLNEENLKRYERLKEVAKQLNTTISAVTLAYLTSQEFPVYPIIGPKNIEQLEDSLSYADLQLDKQTIEYLEGIK
ncbi:aldo/keto reductase [Caldicellulosiruptoraceae bacterium PP1]